MRLREPEMPLDPEIERELAAIEAGLAGRGVEPEREELAELARETRSLRDVPEPEFAAELDERAAREFERGGHSARARARIATFPSRRVLLPAGAAATFLVAVGVGISQLGGRGGPEPVQSPGTAADAPANPRQTDRAQQGARANSVRPDGATFPAAPGARGDLSGQAPGGGLGVPGPTGGLAPNRAQRKSESNAQLTLAAESDQVPDVADGVVDVTHRYHGIVVFSQVTHGDSGAQATFDLAVPSAELDAALADLSDLAHVQSSSEGSLDITAPTVRAHRRIAALRARLANLRGRLAAAIARGDTSARGVIEQRIQYVRSALTRARNRSDELRSRAEIARVSLTVTSDGVAVGGDSWTLDDALHDAGKVLTVTAGVLLVTAAVLAPVALIAVLAWAASQALLRWRRERSLDRASQG